MQTTAQRNTRPFLKWAGGKYRLTSKICEHLPSKRHCLVEPFAGSAALFLNTHYEHYILNDINRDLINLYRILQQHAASFIEYARQFFLPTFNSKTHYYQLREQFNNTQDPVEKAGIFIYLNRHAYNGLCRYNSQGYFNAPFGRYRQPIFPEDEMLLFSQKAARATFTCDDFRDVFANLPSDCAVYCDPPYVPLSHTSLFTSYSDSIFNMQQQQQLAELAYRTATQRDIPVLISNHDVPFTRSIYQHAKIHTFHVTRLISCKGDGRKKVPELLALFTR